MKTWTQVKLRPICIWDCYLHMILPSALMIVYGFITAKDRVAKDERIESESRDIKRVVGSLTQGVVLTVNFPEKRKLAAMAAREAASSAKAKAKGGSDGRDDA